MPEVNPVPEPARGPAPTQTAAPYPAVSPTPGVILAILEQQPSPMTLAALSRATPLHVNTLRGQLAELEAHGRVRRHRATPVGRGRPAWLYEATVPPDTTSVVGYADLAAALADVINRHSPDPRADGIAAGEEWGP